MLFLTKASYTILRKSDFFQFSELRNHIQSQELPIFGLGLIFLAIGGLNWIQLLLSIVACILTLTYGMHVFYKEKSKTLRSSAVLKLIVISAVWTLIVVVVPMIGIKTNLGYKEVIFIIMQFFFILAIAIPFDIIDHKRQSSMGFSTLPSLYGVPTTKQIARSVIILTWIAAGLQGFLMMIIMSFFTLVYLRFLQLDIERSEVTTSIRFDGLVLLQALTIITLMLLVIR